MKIESLSVHNIEPIRSLDIQSMGGVVIIAGANGSGKTRLKQAIVDTFQNASAPQLSMTLCSTRPEEARDRWQNDLLSIQAGQHNDVFASYMNSRTRGGSYTGTLIQIDANRAVTNVNFQAINLSTPDPDDLDMDVRYFLSSFLNRWQDTVNKIYQKFANRDQKIAQYVKTNPDGTSAEALRRFPDPFIPYQEIFAKLLPGKQLQPIDPRAPQEFQYRTTSGVVLPFQTLSSGEQEVIKITFDLLAKRITHCVFLIDEPELHLHPTLTFRLIETLRGIGGGTNQFIFFTHSADLISTYYATGDVYFIDQDRGQENQAHRLSELDASHTELVKAMGDNLGLFAVGKKLVFVEGQHASRDRLTYHSIAQKHFPEAYIVPTGSADSVIATSTLGKELERAVFGINFFMVRDRDGLTDDAVAEIEANAHVRCLKRRHIENYFLDSDVLAKVAQRFCLPARWHAPATIESKLLDIAQRSFNDAYVLSMKEFLRVNRSFEIPKVKDTQIKSHEQVEDEFLAGTFVALQNQFQKLQETQLREIFGHEKARLQSSLGSGLWRWVFPGKLIFERFCGQEGFVTDSTRVRQAYVEIALDEKPQVFQEIADIFARFRSL